MKLLLDSDMELLIPAGEPASTPPGELLGLLQFGHAQHFPEKPAGLRLATRRRRNLHMVNALDHPSIIANGHLDKRLVI